MQLYALDGDLPLAAAEALKGKNYLCPECRALVRLRAGATRQIHFYHPARPKHCRQHQKSSEHLQLQLNLLAAIGGQIECPFPEIRRIADVAWHAKKIVFEIQCSPLPLQEAEERVRDYRSCGYEVIWILHEKRFNRKNVSAAEHFLRGVPCYFTNSDAQGKGMVYDQFEVLAQGRRLFKGNPLPVAITQIAPLPQTAPRDLALPQALSKRLAAWKYTAEGDLLSRLLKEGNPAAAAQRMLALETSLLEKKIPKRLAAWTLLGRAYSLLLNYLLRALVK